MSIQAIVGNGHTLKHAKCMIIQYTLYTYIHAQLYTFAVLRDVLRKHLASVEMYSECDVSIAILFIQKGTAITTLI